METRLREVLEPTVESMGFELWGIELLSGVRQPMLRVYLEGASGVDVEDCASVSHQVSGVLDVEEIFSRGYTLEVSSPGIDRLLFQPRHFTLYLGEIVDIRVKLPIDGRRRFKGTLLAMDGETVVVIVDEQKIELPYASVSRARVLPKWNVI